MGLFSKKSKRTTNNIDNRTVYDMSGSTFDNSVDNSDNSYTDNSDNSYTDNSVSFEDNSYRDNSTNDNSYLDASVYQDDNSYVDASVYQDDNSYVDGSTHNTDNSYHDSSTLIDGQYAGNTGSIEITDSGAFVTVQNAVSDLVEMGGNFADMAEFGLETLGKTADLGLQQATANNELMRDVTESALHQYTALSGDSFDTLESVATASLSSVDNAVLNLASTTTTNQELMRDVTTRALEEVSEQVGSVVNASTAANQEALATTQKLMSTVTTNGNDLLIDGVVNIAKWGGLGLGVTVLGMVAIKYFGGKK